MSDEDHKADIKEWANKMKQKDCYMEKRAFITHLIKCMKEERGHFPSQFTNEFMFARVHHGERIALRKKLQCTPCLLRN